MKKRWKYIIKDENKLSKLLWIDTALGASTGAVGLVFYPFISRIFVIPENIFMWISAVTLFYAFCTFRIVRMKPISILLLWVLLGANVLWIMICLGIMSRHFENASTLGQIFFILQIIIVGGFAWLERNQIDKEQGEII